MQTNTPILKSRIKKKTVNSKFTSLLIIMFCLQLSIQAINNFKDLVSNNLKYYTITQHFEEVSNLHSNMLCDIENF